MDKVFSSPKWTLDSDKQLFELLKELSKETMSKATSCVNKLKQLNDQLELVEIKVRDASNQLQSLKNVQFIDTQIIEVTGVDENTTSESTLKINRFAETTTDGVPSGRGEELDPFQERPLPFIIGSDGFYSDPSVGLDIKLHRHVEDDEEIPATFHHQHSTGEEVIENLLNNKELEEHAKMIFDNGPPLLRGGTVAASTIHEENAPERVLSASSLLVSKEDAAETHQKHHHPGHIGSGAVPPLVSLVKQSSASELLATAATTTTMTATRISMLNELKSSSNATPALITQTQTSTSATMVFTNPMMNTATTTVMEDEDDLFSATPFAMPPIVVPPVAAQQPSQSKNGGVIVDRGPPPPPPRVTRDLLFDDDVDDDEPNKNHMVKVPEMNQPPRTVPTTVMQPSAPPRQPSTTTSTPKMTLEQETVSIAVESIGKPSIIDAVVAPPAPTVPSSSAPIQTNPRRGLFDDDDEDEDEDLIY